MRFYIIIFIFLSLEYASSTYQSFDGNSDCLTDELYGDFTVEEYNNLVKRRKLVRARMQNKLYRSEIDTLFVPVVFHNYYEIIDGTSSRSFCDYESGNNENGVYTNNSDSLCFERAKNALEILNQQFEIMHETIQIKFIPPEDTSLVVDDIKGNGTLFIYNNNWQDIRNNYNIDNVLNIYIDYCIGRENTETGNLECGSVGGWTLYPEYISTISPHGLAITHSAFPGINDNSTGILAHELGHTLGVFDYCGSYPLITTNVAIGLMHPFESDLNQAKLDCQLTYSGSYQQSYADDSIMGAGHRNYPFTSDTGLNTWEKDALNRDPFFFS